MSVCLLPFLQNNPSCKMQGIRVLTSIDPQTSETEGESCASQD